MSACSLLERIPILNSAHQDDSHMNFLGGNKRMMSQITPSHAPLNPGGPGGGGMGIATLPPPPATSIHAEFSSEGPATLERDYYGCYCLKFIVKNGTHITEEKVMEDFGHFGDVVDVRGPGLFSGLRGNHVYVRYIDKRDAETALEQLSAKYHQLTPASISDVLPDNYGLYTISFYNKTGIPSVEVRKEFSKFGEVKNLTGSLDVKGGRVFVSYKEKTSAVQALQAFFFRKDRYPNMKFALPRCEKDYFGCYCLKFYNKSGDVTEEKVHRDFGQFGEVVDVRGPGLFDVTGDDVYVRYKEKSSAEQALIELVGRYDSLCLAPPSDIQADKFGYFTITFVNDKCLSKSDVWYIFSKFGTVACVNGTFDCKKGRVFVSYKEKQGALNALETMLITKEYHLQVSKNSTVRKNDYNVVGGSGAKDTLDTSDFSEFASNGQRANGHGLTSSSSVNAMNGGPSSNMGHESGNTPIKHSSSANSVPSVMTGTSEESMFRRDQSRSREASLVPNIPHLPNVSSPSKASVGNGTGNSNMMTSNQGHTMIDPSMVAMGMSANNQQQASPKMIGSSSNPMIHPGSNGGNSNKNGMVKFNRNVEKDIFGYFCLSFLNEDGDINEKKVRHDFGKFGEVVSVRGALGKQKGHVFVRFRKKESAENCLNCLNSFPLSEMSELFGKYLFLSPATPRDIDCDMYGLYSITFLNLNMKTSREIQQEFRKFGEIVSLTSGGGGNTDELVSISYSEKSCAVRALQTHFTNKEFPYLDIAKGNSLLLVNSSDSSDNEENELDFMNKPSCVHGKMTYPHPPPQGQVPPNNLSHPEGTGSNSSAGGASASSSSSGNLDPFHDPSTLENGPGGKDVVDELLKPFQSYFQIYQTGQYQHLRGDLNSDLHGQNGVQLGPGNAYHNANNHHHPQQQQHQQQQHQQQHHSHHHQHHHNHHQNNQHHHRSPDKKYRIKSVRNGNGQSNHHAPSSHSASSPRHHHRHRPHLSLSPAAVAHSSNSTLGNDMCQTVVENGHSAFADLHDGASHPMDAGSAVSNGPTNSTRTRSPVNKDRSGSSRALSHAMSEPSMDAQSTPMEITSLTKLGQPGPNETEVEPRGTKSLAQSLSPSLSTGSSSPSAAGSPLNSSRASSLQASPEREVNNRAVFEASKSVDKERLSEPQVNPEVKEDLEEVEEEEKVKEIPYEHVVQDFLGFYTLSFVNKIKDLTERKVKLDFEKAVQVRGLNKTSGSDSSSVGNDSIVFVSFADQESAEEACNNSHLRAKYSQLACSPVVSLMAGRDGHFSIEFVNSGMSGIREITQDFSQYGEVVKVMAGRGAKNSVKRVTVSYSEAQSAIAAIKCIKLCKNYASLDFSRECLDIEENKGTKGASAAPP